MSTIARPTLNVYTTDLSSTEIDRWITRARLAPYVDVAGAADMGRATRLYMWNARLAGACIETLLRICAKTSLAP